MSYVVTNTLYNGTFYEVTIEFELETLARDNSNQLTNDSAPCIFVDMIAKHEF